MNAVVALPAPKIPGAPPVAPSEARGSSTRPAGNIIIMPGPGGIDSCALQAIAAEFGWTIDVTGDLCEVAAIRKFRNTVAVFYCHDALGSGYSWLETTRLLRNALPQVRLVACHGFSEPIDWTELSEAGSFHELWLPLKETEVHQCLGFIWEAEKHLSSPGKISLSA
jgi:hypothetical protein